MYPYPIKNWRDESEYQNHRGDLNSWAWEFLRRNPEYQNAVDTYNFSYSMVKLDRLPSAKGEYKSEDELLKHGVYWHGSSNKSLRSIKNKYGIKGALLFDSDSNDFQYIGLVNPFEDDNLGRIFFDITDSIRMACYIEPKEKPRFTPINHNYFRGRKLSLNKPTDVMKSMRDQMILSPTNKYERGFMFDVSKPLGVQLRIASEQLEKLAKKLGVKHDEKRKRKLHYLNCIRVLDALANKVSEAEIAKILLPHVDNSYEGGKAGYSAVTNWINRGKYLRDGGYLELAQLAHKR